MDDVQKVRAAIDAALTDDARKGDVLDVLAAAAMRATRLIDAAWLRERGDCWTTDDEIADWLTNRAENSNV